MHKYVCDFSLLLSIKLYHYTNIDHDQYWYHQDLTSENNLDLA